MSQASTLWLAEALALYVELGGDLYAATVELARDRPPPWQPTGGA